MPRVLPVLVAIVLVVFCLVDLVQSRREDVRTMPRPLWALVIVCVPFLGPLGWLLAGRPRAGSQSRPTSPTMVAPDDNPEFLSRLKERRLEAEDERLRQWQADLERRERDLDPREDRSDPSDPAG
ncbi:PLD nuclease N-terminal domain-containing protein [Actinopolymorpha sp. B17G11]|uniref:PLD nuclease N-terminal domain-containing protein n=1 Tax=unclassified Actinopolymorpha TaxID=2627063 RepID=UPI0032D99BBA